MPRPTPHRLTLEPLESRTNPNVFNDLSQFSEGGVEFGEITPATPAAPPPRSDFGATALNGRLLIFGGTGADGQPLSDLWEFDPATRTWTELPQTGSPPGASTNGTLTTLNSGQVVYFGGDGAGANPFVYNRSTGMWEVRTPNPFGSRAGQTAFAKTEALFVFGGMKPDGTKTNDIFVYVNSVNDWTPLTPSTPKPPPRTDAAGAQIDNTATNFSSFFVFGGDGSELKDAWRFDQQGLVWTQLADMPEALVDARAVTFQDGGATKILVYGGRQGGGFRDAAFVYDVATNTWDVLPDPAPGERAAVSLVNIGGDVLLFGGEGPDAPPAPPGVPPAAPPGVPPTVPPPAAGPNAPPELPPPAAGPNAPPPAAPNTFVVAPGTGGGPIQVFAADGTRVRSIDPFPGFAGGVEVAAGDLTGDGVADTAAVPGEGGGPVVRIFDGATGNLIGAFAAPAGEFRGGLSVAVGDVTGDGVAEVVIGYGTGGGPVVQVFDRAGNLLASFFAFDESFRGGVTVAVADTDRDGVAEILAGAGPGGGPVVAVFDRTGRRLRDVEALPPDFRGGVSLAAGDLTGDGRADLVIGPGPGGGPVVTILDGAGGPTRTVTAFDPGFRGGVSVAVADADRDGRADLIVGPGPGGGGVVKAFRGTDLVEINTVLALGDDFRGGVQVG